MDHRPECKIQIYKTSSAQPAAHVLKIGGDTEKISMAKGDDTQISEAFIF